MELNPVESDYVVLAGLGHAQQKSDRLRGLVEVLRRRRQVGADIAKNGLATQWRNQRASPEPAESVNDARNAP